MSMDEISPPEKGPGLAILAAACVLALGLGSGLYYLANKIDLGLQALSPVRSISTVTRAERLVKADHAVWPLRIVASGADLEALHAKGQADLKATLDFFKAHGFTDDEISAGPLVDVDLLAQGGRAVPESGRFQVHAPILVRSSALDHVQDALAHIGDLVRSGVFLIEDVAGSPSELTPLYALSKAGDVRASLFAEALRAAHAEAEAAARQADVTLGALLHAEEIPTLSSGGEQDDTKTSKKVSITIRAEYAIK